MKYDTKLYIKKKLISPYPCLRDGNFGYPIINLRWCCIRGIILFFYPKRRVRVATIWFIVSMTVNYLRLFSHWRLCRTTCKIRDINILNFYYLFGRIHLNSMVAPRIIIKCLPQSVLKMTINEQLEKSLLAFVCNSG